METRASHFLIGLFVLALLGLGFAFVYWVNNSAGGAGAQRYHVIFSGSVQGLGPGSAVLFNGIRVGEVDNLQIMLEDTSKVRGLISVKPATPVRETSRAKVVQQGLAGVVALEITPGAPDSPPLRAKADEDYPTILADVASSKSLLSAAPEALGEARALLRRLNDLIAANEKAVSQTVQNVEAFTATLSDHREDISAIIEDTRGLSGRFAGMATKLEDTIDKFSKYVADDEDSVVAEAQQAAQSFRRLAEKLEGSLGERADDLTMSAQRGVRQFELFMRDGRRLAESLDRVVRRLEQNPQQLLLGGSQVPEYNPSE
jgi:phospholipid/cholesterol/gamma-HCH transport system substrate-binding protein